MKILTRKENVLRVISVKKTWYKEQREITVLSKKTVDTRIEERRNKGRDEKYVCRPTCLSVSVQSLYLSFLPFTDLGYLSVLFPLAVCVRETADHRSCHALYSYSRDLGSSLWWDTLFSLVLSGKFQNSPVRPRPPPSQLRDSLICELTIWRYTGCVTTSGHNCRRWFPMSLWSKKVHINMCPIFDG
jgi:hypothetical protein